MGIPIYFIYSLSFLPARCMPLYTAKCHASIFPRRKASYRRKYIFYFQRRIGIKDAFLKNLRIQFAAALYNRQDNF